MRRIIVTTIALVLLAGAQMYSLTKASVEQQLLPRVDLTGYALPPQLVRLSAMEFDGLASDLLFMKALMFLAKAGENNTQITEQERQWVYSVLDTATDLDPYFLDPYYFANAYFTGSAAMTRQANRLLEKGSQSRTWDWLLPFFEGFNNFYYLHDNEKASKCLLEASRRPGGPSLWLADLASKLALQESRTENSIAFLEEIYKTIQDQALKRQYEAKLFFLHRLLAIENAIIAYKQQFKKDPSGIDELAKSGFLEGAPKDPLGGRFFIDPEGKVRSPNEKLFLPFISK